MRNDNWPFNLVIWIALVSLTGGVLVELGDWAVESLTWVEGGMEEEFKTANIDRWWNNYKREVNTHHSCICTWILPEWLTPFNNSKKSNFYGNINECLFKSLNIILLLMISHHEDEVTDTYSNLPKVRHLMRGRNWR